MDLIRTRRFKWVGPLGLGFAGYRLWRRASHTQVAVATESPEEVVPSDLTSPGTVSDPELEERRSQEAAERERESRASSMTKFDELRLQEDAERHEHAAVVTELTRPSEPS
jgi:hypothetical protein